VLHVTRAGRKLVEAEQARLMESLERVLNASVAGEAADETR
jgi:hypothetical protein